MAKVLFATMRLSAIARLLGSRRTAVVVLLALTVALAMVAMAIAPSAGALPPDLSKSGEGTGGSNPPPYKPPANGFTWTMEPRFGPDRNRDGVTDFHWNEATASYDQAYVNPSGFRVNFNGCPDRDEYDASGPPEFEAQNQYTWDFGDGSPALTAHNCLPSHRYESQDSYEVKLTVVPRTGTTQTYTQTIEVRDILIAALGDSYGSGEGAPDVPLRTRKGVGDLSIGQLPLVGTWKDWPGGDARWVDKRCHRSAYAGSAQAARMLENSDPHTSVTYISFACSGANISRETYDGDDVNKPEGSGLLGRYRGMESPWGEGDQSYESYTFLPPQVTALARTLAGCYPDPLADAPPCSAAASGRPIDALTISAGGNDAGFAEVLAWCTTGWPYFLQPGDAELGLLHDCYEDHEFRRRLDCYMGASPQCPGLGLGRRYNELRAAIDEQNVEALSQAKRPALNFSQRTPNSGQVFLTEYPDGMRDDDGNNCDSILGDITGVHWPGKINGAEVDWLRPNFHEWLLSIMQHAVNTANSDSIGPKWTYVGGIADPGFATHGYCADDRYINTAEDARVLQGPVELKLPVHLTFVGFFPITYDALYHAILKGRVDTAGKAHPNVRGYRVYADSLIPHLKPLFGMPADDPLPKFEAKLTTADGTSTQGANGWLTGSDASPSRAVLGVSVDDPSGISAAAATINDNTSCPTNTAGAAECSVVDVSAQRKEWHFRFHEDGIHRLEFSAQGGDGQTASYAHDVSVDLHDPEAFAEPSRPPDANGWYTSPVDVMLRGEDPGGGSGVQKMEYTLNDGPVQELVPGEKVAVDAKGTTNLHYQAVDGAGRRSPMQEVTINIDGTPPVIEVPADITEYATGPDGAQVDYSATATDNVDGDVPVDCTPASGSTFPVGTTQVNCSATDAAGNEATKTFNVSVHYDFGNGSGGSFGEPVRDNELNQVKAGAGVPVKFGLGGNMGLDIFATGYPTSKKIACNTGLPVDPIEETAAITNSGLKYDAVAGHYIYGWKTERSWSGTCRELNVKLADGSGHPVKFQFK